MSVYRVLVVEDEAAAAQELLRHLAAHEDFAVACLAASVRQARDFLAHDKLDLAIVDNGLPDGSGLMIATAARELGVPVIFLTGQDLGAREIYELDVLDYLGKPVDPGRLARALERFRGGQGGRTADSAPKRGVAEVLADDCRLTPVEVAICCHFREGLDRDEVAARVGIGKGTLKIHLNHIYAKLGIGDDADDVACGRGEKLSRLLCFLFRL